MSVGPAAQWVTVILFIEAARRANKHLRRAEIFTLFYLAGAIMITASMAQGSFQGGLGALWSQFFVQSDAARAAGVAENVPSWVVPGAREVLERRSLFQTEWLAPIGLIVFTMIIGRVDNMVLGYGLFRLTSDVEKLPFPMAPVGAQGILALSEEQDDGLAARRGLTQQRAGEAPAWRWRVFSIGSVVGLVFGTLYIGVPTLTGALLDRPITILPLPFVWYQETSAHPPQGGFQRGERAPSTKSTRQSTVSVIAARGSAWLDAGCHPDSHRVRTAMVHSARTTAQPQQLAQASSY